LLRDPARDTEPVALLQSVLPLSGPGSGVPATAICHSALVGRRLPALAQACWAWNQVILLEGVTPNLAARVDRSRAVVAGIGARVIIGRGSKLGPARGRAPHAGFVYIHAQRPDLHHHVGGIVSRTGRAGKELVPHLVGGVGRAIGAHGTLRASRTHRAGRTWQAGRTISTRWTWQAGRTISTR
ncbi:MAG: hypothetical protein ACREB3_11440, partial [Burkholderiales bacterium]